MTVEEKDQAFKEIMERCVVVADCWVYQGATNKFGYGMKKIGDKVYTVSRFVLAYSTRESLDKPGYDACHKDEICPYKACCNPRHLYWATKSENCKAREKRAREERNMFNLWEQQAWIDGVYYTDRSDPTIDQCLASLNRGKMVHATTELWEDSPSDKMYKVLCFLADISRQTLERWKSNTRPPLTIA